MNQFSINVTISYTLHTEGDYDYVRQMVLPFWEGVADDKQGVVSDFEITPT